MNKTLLFATVGAFMLVANFSIAQTTTTPATTPAKTPAKKTTSTTTATKKVVTPRKTVTKTTTVTTPAAPVEKKPSAADLATGKELISKADCLACHKIEIKLIGPAYNDVAKKYPASEANYALLSKKVIAGGSGNWGTVAMAPHPAIPPDDVKKMVEYILSLK